MRRFTTAALFLFSPALATAQCLNAASIEGGITVEYGNGNLSYLERGEDGIQLDSYMDKGYAEKTILFRSYGGVFNAGQAVHRNDTWEASDNVAVSYDFEIPAAQSLAAGDRGNGVRTNTDADYGPTTDAFGWEVYASEPLVVGDCSYDTVRVFTHAFSFRYGNLDLREIKYLPELGIGLQVGNSYFGFSADNAEIISLTAN